MKIARVFVRESSAEPRVAIERDGSLYDVGELDLAFDTRFSPERFGAASDFQTRVVALGGVGLDDLDLRLRQGDRPSGARLLPEDIVWLPPCDTERAFVVEVETNGLRVDTARALVGHDMPIPLGTSEGTATVSLGIGVVVGEDGADGAREPCGYCVAARWSAADVMETQLGPVLASPDELGDGDTRLRVRSGDRVLEEGVVEGVERTIDTAIHVASARTTLRAGDVVVLFPHELGCTVDFGARTDVVVERLGKLSGRAVRTPAVPARPFQGLRVRLLGRA